MKASTIRRLHRWLGLIFSLGVLASASSGVLHVIMAHKQSPPPAARPGGGLDPSAILIAVADAIKALPANFGNVLAVNLRMIGGEPWYQIYGSQSVPTYVSARDGRVDPSKDDEYASEIAAAFLGNATVHKTDYLTAFNSEYINIFRILPVHRFDSSDGLGTRVYVSTTTGSVTRHTNDQMQFEANVFTNLHKLAFIPNRLVRDIILSTLTAGSALAAIAGIVLFFMTRKK